MAENPETKIRILGINRIGQESGNDLIVVLGDIPWLQDTVGQHVWDDWAPTRRDVVILDEENRPVGKYNLTDHSLLSPANYQTMKEMLLTAAGEK